MKPNLRLMSLVVIAGLLCTLLLGRLPRAHAGNPVQVYVTILRVVEKQCDEGFSEPCPNDFYARVGINNLGIDVSNRFGDNMADVSPNATFTRTVDSDLGTIPIFIELDDHDSTSSDDVIDIAPDGGRALGLTLDLHTGQWSGSGIAPNSTVAEGTGLDSARIFFDITLGNRDFDGDGIPDGVERFGVYDASGALAADMATLGADPCRPTIAVEIDYMEDATHSHKPKQAALDEVVAAFNAAPVTAPGPCPYAGFPKNGGKGINLIYDVDDAVPEEATLTALPGATPTPVPQAWTDRGEAIRNANFDPARRPYFHYSLWAHDQQAGNSSSGLCCSDSTKDVLVTLGSWANKVGTVRDQSGTFMHELGHALGLNHGGGRDLDPTCNPDTATCLDEINCKPNYLSVMSYGFQLTGIPDPTIPLNVDLVDAKGKPGQDGVFDASMRLDYSRSKLPTLVESALVEPNGIGDGTDRTFWKVNDADTLWTSAGNQPIDWDVDNPRNATETVSVDLNDWDIRECGTDSKGVTNTVKGETMLGYNDWANIKYRAVLSPDAGFTPAKQDLEIDYATAQSLKAQIIAIMKPLAGFIVNSTGDSPDANVGDGVCSDVSGNCTLRAAIQEVNASAGGSAISFDISGPGCDAITGVCTINISSQLPTIIKPVTIDGYTQHACGRSAEPCARENTLPDGEDAVLLVELKGQFNYSFDGLVIGASDSIVQGLAIHGFNHAIILAGDRSVAGANGNVVRGNFIGTNVAGNAVATDSGATGNYAGAILIDGGGFKPNGDPGTANNNVIGGTSPGARNVLSGNGFYGVQIAQNISSASATGNLIQGNFVGTNAAGTVGLGGGDGILINTPSNTVGGTEPGARNVISGNNYNPFTSDGVNLDGINAHDNKVQGNFIGTDVTGTVAIPNGVHGVTINNNSNNNTVGGTTPAARNIISGNTQSGVTIGVGSNNSVKGNFIGTDVTGTLAVPNRFIGVLLGQTSRVTIGGTEAGAGNLISGNLRGGIDIDGTNTVVQGNLIGTKADGVSPLGNAQFGVRVFRADNLIGGRTAGAGNVIAFTRFADPFSDNAVGVIVYGSNTNATIAGNSIYGNEGIGIDLGRDWISANDNCDGDASDGASNKLQNYPVLSSASSNGSNTTIAGTLNSAAGTTFTLDFYANPACDSWGVGEGQTYLGSATTTTDGACNANFNVTVPVAVAAGQVITATATDPGGNTSEFSACVTVTSANSAPDAVNDAATTNEDTPVTISVLANDTDPDGDPLSISGFTQGANGSVANGGGMLTYTPNANYNGSDSFTYTISDGHGGSDTATVNITVNAVNNPPDAMNDSASTNEDTSVNINVRANDTGGDCGSVTIVSVTQGAHGTVVINPDSTLRYTPDANFNGADSFTYTIGCAAAGNDTANVSVTIAPVNDAPVANNDTYATNEDNGLNVTSATGVLANDSDTEGDGLTAALVSGPANGTLTLNPNGSFTYTPNSNFNGADSFIYKANDGTADSNIATVTINVTPVNDAPDAIDDASTTPEDTAATISVLSNDTDVDGDTLAVSAFTQGTRGSVTANPGGSLTYTPSANYNGSDSFTYTISDGHGGTDTATVTVNVTPVNDAPDALDDAATTAEDTPVTISVLANDTDIENDPLSVSSVTAPAKGSVVINADGTITYTPNANFNGADSFTYTVSDSHGGTDTANVSITVTPVADPPDARDDAATTPEDTPVNINVLANDTDADGDTLAVQSVRQGANGSVAINADGSLRYSPNANFNGNDAFTYTISDGHGGSDTANVTVIVSPVNDAPVAVGDSYATNENTALVVPAPGVLANDSDPDGASLSALLVTAPSHGVLGWNANGSFTYTPAANYNGGDSFTYKANDGSLSSNIATVSIAVVPVNDAPVAVNDSYSTNQNTALNVAAPGVLSNDTDPDSASISAVLASGPANGTLTLNANGSFNYAPANNFSGTDSFTYRASDGALSSNAATVTITVNPPANPTWTPTGTLRRSRANHTATLLPNGKVLIAGGFSSDPGAGFLNSAELYDPATGSWTLTGSLNKARAHHTATLLPNGKVLVVGGLNANGSSSEIIKSAELYDPVTGTWTLTGELITARYRHAAALLSNGKVLVAGGVGIDPFLQSAELYDPANGRWSATGNMNVRRVYHTATRLPDGNVLVAGGVSPTNKSTPDTEKTTELYDPATGRWRKAQNMRSARWGHTATLLSNGTVLVVGGYSDRKLEKSAELYDPATDKWRDTPDLNITRDTPAFTATLLLSGKVLIAGATVNASFLDFARTEFYDPAAGRWIRSATLNVSRTQHTATLLPSGRVLIAGGLDENGRTLGSAELYDPHDSSVALGGPFAVTPLETLLGFGWASSATPFSLTGNYLLHDPMNSSAGPYQVIGGFWH